MPPKPDLASHTVAHFLDRFVYRNAKASVGTKGNSIMQPIMGTNKDVLLSNRPGKAVETVNTEAFWRKKVQDINVEDVFFHKYFNQVGGRSQASKKGHIKSAGDRGEGEDEDEVWSALVKSRPEVEGDFDSGSELGFSASDLSDMQDDASQSDDAGVPSFSDDDAEDMANLFDDLGSDVNDDDASVHSIEDGETAGDELQAPDEDKPVSEKKQRRRRLKDLPLFASATDYAAMIDGDGDEELGF